MLIKINSLRVSFWGLAPVIISPAGQSAAINREANVLQAPRNECKYLMGALHLDCYSFNAEQVLKQLALRHTHDLTQKHYLLSLFADRGGSC